MHLTISKTNDTRFLFAVSLIGMNALSTVSGERRSRLGIVLIRGNYLGSLFFFLSVSFMAFSPNVAFGGLSFSHQKGSIYKHGSGMEQMKHGKA